MIAIPRRINEWQFDLILILEDDNLKRINKYDPAKIDIDKIVPLAPWITRLSLNSIYIGYATVSDMTHIFWLSQNNKSKELFEFISRGFEFRPDLGDDDEPYKRIK